ncbi:MAG: S8 family serine peptidase, partial [Clostridia bacterium]
VLDTGLDYTHPDLENVMADMSAYSALGFGKYGINCARGDTQRPKNDPMDEQYHGTHVAGIIAAEWDERGVSGISKGAKVVGVKLGGVKSFSMLSAIEGFESLALAMDAGLNLVATNNSYASTGGSATILSIAVAKLGEKGAISVFASGNEDSNLDKSPSTVSGLMHNPYVVSVNASTILGERAPFSNYGVSSTDVFAPGMSIVSSVSHAENPYSITPQGNEALYESFKPGETPKVSFFNSANFDALGSAVGSLSEPMHFDDKGSWTIPSTQLSAQPDSANARSVVLKIPVEKNALEKARYIGFNVLLSKNKMEQGYLQVTPFMESEKAGLLRDDSQVATNQVGDGWNRCVFDLKKLQTMKEGSGGLVYYEEAGSSYLLLGLDLRSNYWEAPDSSLYFDNIGVGYQTSCYLSMSGTSMASPAVAGAAAVHAKNLGAS